MFTNMKNIFRLRLSSGIIAAQEKVVRGYYKARLAVMNMGDGFSTGPNEAAM